MCPTRYLKPPTNTSPLIPPSPNTFLSFSSLPFIHTIPPPLPTINHPPPHLISFNAALIIARSICNKISSVNSLVIDHDLDILFVTKTWLSPLDSPHIAHMILLTIPPTVSFTTLATLSIPVVAPEYFTNLL